MQTLYITHPSCRLHEMGRWHPESPDRLDAISDQMLSSGIAQYVHECNQVEPVSREALLRVHTEAYLAELERVAPTTGTYCIDLDTLMNPHTLDAARHAAGAAVAAVDAVMQDEAKTAFCCVRPPGHHAMPDHAMGFCFFNNIAVAAAHAMAVYGLKRIAIIDFDVHHGNGTEAMFADHPGVLMCSFFQHPLFPNTGTGPHAANMVNVPVPSYSGGSEIRKLICDQWLPKLEAHRPELILISAGFDAHREDDIAQLKLVESDYAWITDRMVEIADKYAGGRIVSTLEGGYNLSALGRSVVAHIRSLALL
jgi:acetoin utilization deacetylase AcuC-like enzyme